MVQKKNLVKLAKKKTLSQPTHKTIRNLNPKEVVDELLSDVSLTLLNKNNAETNIITNKNEKNIKWLEEQVDSLTSENEKLRYDLADLKTNQISDNIKIKIIEQFNEFQTEYFKHTPQHRHLTTVNLKFLMDKFINDHPFLNNLKKY